MASSLLDSIGHFLESCVDRCIPQLYDSMLLDSQNDLDSSSPREIKRLNSRYGEIRCFFVILILP